ncbi:MAG: hypothetical protein KatS3mg077_3061 [Candidatus Binatia bacterium]|nr:MAG: hypothetical protein KatS3mg077_3061 [Candidatus Binatia bacterium]
MGHVSSGMHGHQDSAPEQDRGALVRHEVLDRVGDKLRGSGRMLCARFLGHAEYGQVLSEQERLVRRKLEGDPVDYLLLLEHEPVFTLGRGASEADLCGANERLRIPAYRVSRGGGVTYHGPGQLVAYPIVKLPHPDVRSYVRFLAGVVVGVCQSFGVDSWADEQRIGVWSRRGKLASFGIGLRRWVAFHGVALNVSRAAEEPFAFIVPCRTVGLAVSSLEGEGRATPSVDEVALVFAELFVAAWANYWEQGRPEWKFDEDTRLG